MFLTFLLPFTDLRPFADGASATRVARPAWPLARPGEDFVRACGGVKERSRGGLVDWAGEDVYSAAQNAVRFRSRLNSSEVGGQLRLRPRALFRRYYSDGVVARLELGMYLSRRGVKMPKLEGQDLLRVLLDCFQIRLRVPAGEGNIDELSLIDAGKALAAHFLRATTVRESGVCVPNEYWWFQANEPLCLVEASPQIVGELPRYSKTVAVAREGFELAYCRIANERRHVGIWFLRPRGTAARHDVRQMRIHLLRMHAEFESVRRVLSELARGRLSVTPGRAHTDCLEDFLNRCVGRLQRRHRYGIEQAPLLEAAKRFSEESQPGRRASLDAELERVRRNVRRKVQRFADDRMAAPGQVVNLIQKSSVEFKTMTEIRFGRDVVVTGDFNAVIAGSIEESFNKSSRAQVPHELKRHLEVLPRQVAEMIKGLNETEGEQVARDLQALTAEAVSDRPRRRWYQLSAEGLIDAAKAIGAIGKPVIETVRAIMTLLG